MLAVIRTPLPFHLQQCSPLCTIAQASLLKRGARGGDRGGITHCAANQRARRPSEQSQLPSCRGGRFRLVGSLGRGVVGQMPTVSRYIPSIPERCIGAAVHLTSIYLMASGFRGATAAFWIPALSQPSAPTDAPKHSMLTVSSSPSRDLESAQNGPAVQFQIDPTRNGDSCRPNAKAR
jgi:hypothetical protein